MLSLLLVLNMVQIHVHFKMTKILNNEVNLCKSNPCEQKALVSDCCEHKVTSVFFYFHHDLMTFCPQLVYLSSVAGTACP